MKKAAKSVFLITAFVFCLSLFSCSAETEPDSIPEYDASFDSNDLNGFVMDYYSSPVTYITADCCLGYLLDTEFADLAAVRIKEVEEKLNCDIRAQSVTSDTVRNRLPQWVSAGISMIDAFQDETNRVTDLMRSGYLVGLSDYLDVKNTEKWGTPGMNMSMFWKDDQYGVLPWAWPELFIASVGYPLCVNENIVSHCNLTDPREYVENNTWTWDVFEDYVHKMTYDTGSYMVYGFGAQTVYWAQMMFRSNGDMLLDFTSRDPSVCGYYTDTAYEALDRCSKIIFETCADCMYPSTNRTLLAEKFRDGEVGIVCSNTEFILGTETSYVYTNDNFGVLPCPQGPASEPGDYRSVCETMDYNISIPVIADGIEETAAILDALYEPFEQYPTLESRIDYMANYTFHDERDAKVLYKLAEKTEFAFYPEGARALVENIVGYSTNPVSVAQALESYKEKYQNVYDTYIVHHYEGMKAIWGDEIG